MKAPIVSRKHYVQFTEFTIASGAVLGHTYVAAEPVVDVNVNFEVIEGSIIKSVFLEYWFRSSVTNGASFVLILEKIGQDLSGPSFSQIANLDAYPNKKNILYTTQGLVSGSGDNPIPLLRGWFKIPKGKQRFGLNDRLRITVGALGANGLTGCAFGTYKSYS